MEEKNKKEEVELLDLTGEIEIKNKKENKKIYNLIIFIFILTAIFILFLPDITSYIKNLKLFNNTTENDKYSKNLIDGFVQIGIDSYMTTSSIKFYGFTKKSNNSIEFNYISDKSIENVNKLKLSIGIYNKAKELLINYTFNVNDINKSEINVFKINLTAENYIKATYAKVLVGQTEEKTTMKCIYDKTIDNVNLYYEIKYYFNNEKLYKYDVNKNILYAEKEENETLVKYKEELSKEYNSLLKTNLNNIENSELILKYSVDISSFDKKDSDYSLLYELNTNKETIKNNETNNEWVCE
jgi:hypothetical protein